MEFAKKELVTINLLILTGLNLTLEDFSQFFFGVFFVIIFTAKHSSIKAIVMGFMETSVNIFRVKRTLDGEAITS
tara:strand:- start:161 stop:385 length:225 start_codon:yes stop_codon:yes gene_type:complete